MRLPSVPGPRDVVALVERCTAALDQVLAAAPRLGRLLDDVEQLVAQVNALITRIEGTRSSADDLIGRLEPPVQRLLRLLDSVEPPLTALQPTLERLAETTDPKEVDALVALVDQLPLLVGQLERDVLPVLSTLGSVAPDLHDLLDTSKQLNEMLARLPGYGRIKQRVEDEQAARGD
jgi:hypothetical protein